jgi:hypothetical protein
MHHVIISYVLLDRIRILFMLHAGFDFFLSAQSINNDILSICYVSWFVCIVVFHNCWSFEIQNLCFKLDLHLQEYSLPPQEVPAEKAAEEKPEIATEAEPVPASNDEAPPAAEAPATVEDKSETSVQDDVDKSEAEETNTATEEATETAQEEEAEEKAEIKV